MSNKGMIFRHVFGDRPANAIKLAEEVVAASTVLSAANCYGNILNNYGQTDDVLVELPYAAEGLSFIALFSTTVAKYYRFDPKSTDKIYLDGEAGGDGKYAGISSVTAGYAIQFRSFKTEDGTYDWYAGSIAGPWTLET